jgi:hypothetical protein
VWWLRGGASIETNVNHPRTQHTAPVCQSCTVREACLEGWMGCGIRITADLKASGCVLRPDLAMPVYAPGDGYVAPLALDAYIAGATAHHQKGTSCCSTENGS